VSRNNEDRAPRRDKCGPKASSRSVAMVRAVFAACVGRADGRQDGRRDAMGWLTSETQCATTSGGGWSGQRRKHGGAIVFVKVACRRVNRAK
jgi:hypothetical protein